MSAALTLVVERLGTDIVQMAQCMAIDADAFPYASAQFAVRSASSRVWVAREEQGSRVLGFVAGRVREGRMGVAGLAVDRSSRRHGIGRALVREVVAYARSRRLKAVLLQVSVANAGAIALYGREGFAVVSTIRGYYPAAAFPGQRDAYTMALVLAR